MKKALIVGLNNYPGRELEWCNNDAIAMKELIESNGDGSPNFEVVPIIDNCSKSNLMSAIGKLFADDAEYITKVSRYSKKMAEKADSVVLSETLGSNIDLTL